VIGNSPFFFIISLPLKAFEIALLVLGIALFLLAILTSDDAARQSERMLAYITPVAAFGMAVGGIDSLCKSRTKSKT
jgi:hypothetical protein